MLLGATRKCNIMQIKIYHKQACFYKICKFNADKLSVFLCKQKICKCMELIAVIVKFASVASFKQSLKRVDLSAHMKCT